MLKNKSQINNNNKQKMPKHNDNVVNVTQMVINYMIITTVDFLVELFLHRVPCDVKVYLPCGCGMIHFRDLRDDKKHAALIFMESSLWPITVPYRLITRIYRNWLKPCCSSSSSIKKQRLSSAQIVATMDSEREDNSSDNDDTSDDEESLEKALLESS